MKLTATIKLYILPLALMAMKHGVAANEPVRASSIIIAYCLFLIYVKAGL
jgi:hypothetical protein